MSIVAYVGIDAHDATLSICVLGEERQPLLRTKIANNYDTIRKTFLRYAQTWDLRCCYEAGSLGFSLQRTLSKLGIACEVIAPSLVPKKPGERIKTDKRDALKLAQLYKADQLSVVHVPSPAEESVRRVTRLREQMVRDVTSTKNAINRFLAANDRFYPGKTRWNPVHWKWLNAQIFDDDHDQFVLEEMKAMLHFKLLRLQEVERRIEALAEDPTYKEKVGRLCCLKGVGFITAITLISEITDFQRFPTASALMCYLGLVPSEHSSGDTRIQGKITKTGNAHCRRVIVESAWKYRTKPKITKLITARQKGQPAAVVAHAWKAQKRLSAKFQNVADRKPNQVAAVAVARELTGFIWAIMNNQLSKTV